MKQTTFLLKTCTCLLLIFLAMGKNIAQNRSNYAPDRLIVKFRATAKPACSIEEGHAIFAIAPVDALNARYHCTSALLMFSGNQDPLLANTYLLYFPAGIEPVSLAKEYLNTGFFEYAEPDFAGRTEGSPVVPNDPFFYRQWALFNNGTFSYDSAKAGADIKMEEAWELEQGDTSITVAIIDDGAKLDHPEFAGRIWINHGEIANNGIDDDHNGYTDDAEGWNFAYGNNNPTDDNGHGTNVAGIIGANGNNGIGYAGMDWHCKLMILKGTDSTGHGYYSDWTNAIYYAVANGARIINMSLGGSSYSSAMDNAITFAYTQNVLVVAAMGNGDSSAPSYPGACAKAMAVGATNDHDVRVSPFFWGGGSNYGPYISVVAPGNYIYGLNNLSNTDFSWYWGGTSQATPHVAGLAALLMAKGPAETAGTIRSIIETTADDTVGNRAEDVPGWDPYYGHGRINALRAMLAMENLLAVNTLAEPNLNLYPNPGAGLIYVRMSEDLAPLSYRVCDILGAELLQGVCQTGQSRIDLSSLTEGTYYIRFSNGRYSTVKKQVLRY